MRVHCSYGEVAGAVPSIMAVTIWGERNLSLRPTKAVFESRPHWRWRELNRRR